jgi:hypothetical protein
MTKPRLDLYRGHSGTFCRHFSVSASFDISNFFLQVIRSGQLTGHQPSVNMVKKGKAIPVLAY